MEPPPNRWDGQPSLNRSRIVGRTVVILCRFASRMTTLMLKWDHTGIPSEGASSMDSRAVLWKIGEQHCGMDSTDDVAVITKDFPGESMVSPVNWAVPSVPMLWTSPPSSVPGGESRFRRAIVTSDAELSTRRPWQSTISTAKSKGAFVSVVRGGGQNRSCAVMPKGADCAANTTGRSPTAQSTCCACGVSIRMPSISAAPSTNSCHVLCGVADPTS
mmetsp:Transcript_40615/g.65886  ORF Transcript_40615/g.65886 Transcript_40615/m.65886 type:complete len:217 (+) Transcript_40615:263-913(+)